MAVALASQKDVKSAAQLQQIAGAKRGPSGGDATELVHFGDVGERGRNRLRPPAVIQVDETCLTPMRRTSDDIYLPAARGQKRMGNDRLCRRYANMRRS